MTIQFVPVFPENPGNPARCHVPTGRIEINRQVWDVLTPEQRQFVLQHEVGHYRLQTFNECRADDYALEQLALKKRNSLWNFITSVRAISKNEPKRVRNAERNALRIASENGSTLAGKLLGQYANADGSRHTGIRTAWALAAITTLTIIICIIYKTQKQ